MSRLEDRAMDFAVAQAEIKRLTGLLGEYVGTILSDDYGPKLTCTNPVIYPSSQTRAACRKWTYERGGDEYGDGEWISARDREDWCPSCIEVQRIHDERRVWKKKRGAAIRAVGNIGRTLLRESKAIEVLP